MESNQEEELPLVVEREVEMVPPASSAEPPIKRSAWFLNPIPASASAAAPTLGPTSSPLPLLQNPSFSTAEPPKILFRGWAAPLRRWTDWFCKLRPIYGEVWKKVGILDALSDSAFKIKKDPSSILGIASFWCAETNTFVFPWAEATVTLEDVMVLGRLPVIGESIRGSLPGELAEIEQRMLKEHRNFNRSTSKKADQSAWMRHFIEGERDEVEHVAFLALWLSRFVFPAPPIKTVKQHVLPIAIRLAHGMRIALAPAFLASLYRDLRLVKHHLVGGAGSQKEESLVVWSPFNLLQLWLWERFPALRPEKLTTVDNGESGAARWHDIGRKMGFSLVHSVLGSPSGFIWRPYANTLENSSFGKDDVKTANGNPANDDELWAFGQCLKACELVGLDCIEQYLPHRVSMQFGLDQDIPCSVPRANSSWREAWETYDMHSSNVTLYVPSQLLQPGVTHQYLVWWKQWMLPCANDIVKIDANAEEPQHFSVETIQVPEKIEAEDETKKVHSSPNRKRKLQEFYDTMFEEWLDSNTQSVSPKDDGVEEVPPQNTTAEAENQLTQSTEEKAPMEQQSLSEPAEENEMKENLDPCKDVKAEETEKSDQVVNELKEPVGDYMRKKGKKFTESVSVVNTGGFVHSDELNFKMDHSIQKRMLMKAEETELQLEIKKIKEEIAAIEARAMGLDPLSEVLS